MENIENPQNRKTEKLKHWEEEKKHVENITDRLGKKVDDGIKETVIILHLLGINTHGSCEGHADDKRTVSPFVDIWSAEVSRLEQKLKSAKTKEEAQGIFDEIVRKNLEEREKIKVLLDEFNENRETQEYNRLIIKNLARGWSRVENKENELKMIKDIEERKKRLVGFKEEMKDFTEFLKNKYAKI